MFENFLRIITDKGTAFTSNDFKTYCDTENIEHIVITTGVQRGNGQVERIHTVKIPSLSKLSHQPDKWYNNTSTEPFNAQSHIHLFKLCLGQGRVI